MTKKLYFMSESPNNPLTSSETPKVCQFGKNREIKRRELAPTEVITTRPSNTPQSTNRFHPKYLLGRFGFRSIKEEDRPDLSQATSCVEHDTFEEIKKIDRPEASAPPLCPELDVNERLDRVAEDLIGIIIRCPTPPTTRAELEEEIKLMSGDLIDVPCSLETLPEEDIKIELLNASYLAGPEGKNEAERLSRFEIVATANGWGKERSNGGIVDSSKRTRKLGRLCWTLPQSFPIETF